MPWLAGFLSRLEWFAASLEQYGGHGGIAVNLGASGLIDVEGDSPEAEATLDDLCKGLEFPYYRSQRSKHRIFQAHEDVGHLDCKLLKIELRAGRHYSVIPPSIMEGVKYESIITPFECPPPPLPGPVLEFYHTHKNDPRTRTNQPIVHQDKRALPIVDPKDYVLRNLDLFKDAKDADWNSLVIAQM